MYLLSVLYIVSKSFSKIVVTFFYKQQQCISD